MIENWADQFVSAVHLYHAFPVGAKLGVREMLDPDELDAVRALFPFCPNELTLESIPMAASQAYWSALRSSRLEDSGVLIARLRQIQRAASILATHVCSEQRICEPEEANLRPLDPRKIPRLLSWPEFSL